MQHSLISVIISVYETYWSIQVVEATASLNWARSVESWMNADFYDLRTSRRLSCFITETVFLFVLEVISLRMSQFTWRSNINIKLDKQDYTHACARAHTHTHTEMCNIYCFSTATTNRERASVLRHTYIVCLVIHYSPGATLMYREFSGYQGSNLENFWKINLIQ